MPYVMVPVPEEHEQELMAEVLRMSLRKSLGEWEVEPLRAVFEESEPTARALITVLARASNDKRTLSRKQIAEATGAASADLVGLSDQVNARCITRKMPYLILTAPEKDVGGAATGEVLVIGSVAAQLLAPMLDAPDAGTSDGG